MIQPIGLDALLDFYPHLKTQDAHMNTKQYFDIGI
jgi:hypothetical protein